MMIDWGVLTRNKKRIFVYTLIVLPLVSAFFLIKFEMNRGLKREELSRINQYLLAETEYSIEEIPTWVSLAPMSNFKELSYPQYIIQSNGSDQMEPDKLIYYYPFANRTKAEECYNLLSLIEKECYDLVSSSLLYPSVRDQEYIKLSENMKQYFSN